MDWLLLDRWLTVNLLSLLSCMIDLYILLGLFKLLGIVYRYLRLFIKGIYFLHLLLSFLYRLFFDLHFLHKFTSLLISLNLHLLYYRQDNFLILN